MNKLIERYKLKNITMIKQGLLIIAIVALVQCTGNNSNSINQVKSDSIIVQEKIEVEDIINHEWFSSTLDTSFIDTLWNSDNFLIIESISDSLYNSYYNVNNNLTNVINVPYNYKDRQWNVAERKRIESASGLVHRDLDTLILELDSTKIKLVDCKEGCEVGYSYYYVNYLKEIECHLVYMATEWGGLLLYSKKYGRISYPVGRKIFTNDSMTQMIFCEVQANELDGGWFNYLKWIDTKKGNPFTELFDFDPRPYDSVMKIWGFRDPIWISDNSLICKYVVCDYSSQRLRENFCFVKINLRKKSRS